MDGEGEPGKENQELSHLLTSLQSLWSACSCGLELYFHMEVLRCDGERERGKPVCLFLCLGLFLQDIYKALSLLFQVLT